jgi:hypothetical protein
VPDDPLISVSDAGRRLGVSSNAITRWIVDGAKLRDGSRLRLRAIRLPGGFRTTERWLDEFVEALTRDRTGSPVPSAAAVDSSRRSDAALAASGW